MKSVYVFGHKNPDTDSVCSAIALAYLKNALGMRCVPKVIGPVSYGTKYVLDYFNVPEPSYLNDVRVQIKDVKFAKKAYINENDSIDNAFNFMKKNDLTAIPLVDDNKILTGYITLKELAKHLIGDKRDYLDTNLKLLLTTLGAKIITNYRKEFKGSVKAATFSSESFMQEVALDENSIVIVGDRFKVLEYAIDSKVQLIVLAGSKVIPQKLLTKAVKNKINIITSKYTAFELCNRISLANYIKTINVTPNPTTIDINSYYTDFLNLSKKLNYTNYPVVKKNRECLGVLKLTDSSTYEKKKVMLVDHNNYEQSIEGLEEAEILEVFDHHNIGNLGTSSPIYFTCRPVGCTATIIYDCFLKEGVECPQDIAGLLLSAIISDTLLFTSPTTTPIDISYAKRLAKLAKVKLEKYGLEMLKAASTIKGLSVTEAINQDFKKYNINDNQYGIANIITMDYDEIAKKLDEYVAKLDEMSKDYYKGVLIFVTDVIKEGSYVLYNKGSEDLVAKAFEIKDIYEGIFIPGLISRKKQMLPAIMKMLER